MSKNKNTIAIAVLTGLMTFAMVPAQASNNVAFAVKSDVAPTGMLTQVGTPSGVMSPLKGFAKDLPLVTVMKQITPNGWKVKKIKTGDTVLDNNTLVSWNGGSSWLETLNSVVKSTPVNATVYWAEKEIVLSPVVAAQVRTVAAPAPVLQKNAIFELSGLPETTDVTVGGSEQVESTTTATTTTTTTTTTTEAVVTNTTTTGTVAPAQEAAVAPVAVEEVKVVAPVVVAPAKTWTMEAGKSLKSNVTKWGQEAGYKVVWYGEDYPNDDHRVLTGEFDSIEGPIKALADDYGPESLVEKPLSFEFLQNSTLVVKNFRFEQVGFPQLNR